jgi:hypothetical protein
LSHFRNDFGCWNFLYLKSALNLIATLAMHAYGNQECRTKQDSKNATDYRRAAIVLFATIRRPKTEKPRAKPSKLIAVDILSSRFRVLILMPVVDLAARAAHCLAVGLRQLTKALKSPSFRKSAELAAPLSGVPF